VYVVPITYVYEDGHIFSHSLDGKKIEMMRSNPKVCVQVEEVYSLFNWRSVIIHGRFEELKNGLEAEQGLRLLKYKIAGLANSKKISFLEVEFDAILSQAKIFRIKIEKVTGRSENRSNQESIN
jgi:nitroimidazol reductase NimA-like FMN-containing flavoprotein (pyridoxamine 5'-phosphate oxidase superfamily)